MIQPKYQNYLVVSLSVLAVGVTMAMVQYKVPTIMIAIMEQYAMSASGGSWLMSIFTLMMAVTAIVIGELSVRMSPKRIIVFATCLIVLGSVMGAFAPNGIVLLVSRGIEGIALTAVTTCGPLVIQESVAPGRIGTSMGIWGMWGSLGSAIAAFLTPLVFAFAGLTSLWLFYGALVVIATVIMCICVRDPFKKGSPVAPEDAVNASEGASGVAQSDVTPGKAAASHIGAKPSYRELLTKDVLLFFCGFIAFNICLLAVLSLVPSILQMRGMDVSLSGFVSTLPMIISVASSPFFGMLSDKTGKTKWLLVFCLFFLGPCTFVLYNFEGAVMWVGAVVMGVIGMGTTGLMITAFMKVISRPELATIGMGVLICVQGIGQFLGTFLVQGLLGPSFENTLLAGSVVMVIGLVGTLCTALCKMR
ncbi:MAG TPA: MFS transporter [Coriobacteriaceae bacterium]|nr:MFS transporter [Coriobacteriaceae bacterium]